MDMDMNVNVDGEMKGKDCDMQICKQMKGGL